jgi:lantibiotic modifying enzyme
MRDARDRDEALDVLRQAAAHHPFWRQLADHELADLWAGDIPLMSARIATRDISTSSGQVLPRLLEAPGLDSSLEKVAAMNEVDRRDQEWLISASMTTRRPDNGHLGAPPSPESVSAIAAEPGRLLAAACGLADQIVARAMTGRGDQARGRVNWVGLQLMEDSRWMVLPMGAGLADGYLGVALFLAQLADLTGIGRYAEVAGRAVSALPQLLDVLAGEPALLSAVGCGGLDGLGGISYGLARIATLLGDTEVGVWAGQAAELAAAAAAQPAAPPGWAAGTAGCLAAMMAVRAETGSAMAASAARACAERLSDLVEQTNGRCVPAGEAMPAGFAAGPSGIGWALARFALAEGRARYSHASRLAIWRGGEPTVPDPGQGPVGWCQGAVGRLIARTCLVEDTGTDQFRPALARLSKRPVLSDLSLCHGEMGIAESLIILAATIGDSEAARAQRHRAALILGAVDQDGRHCGTPGGTPTPGLLNGLAGIGYGLLRLGFADQVPSALLLEPGPHARGGASQLSIPDQRIE